MHLLDFEAVVDRWLVKEKDEPDAARLNNIVSAQADKLNRILAGIAGHIHE
jgi:hypothetical protein